MENKVFDSVKFPSHYVIMDGKFEVRHLVEDRLRSLKQSTYKPNNPLIYSNYADAIEYLLRFHLKNGVQDLKKAQRVIQFMIDAYENDKGTVTNVGEYCIKTDDGDEWYEPKPKSNPYTWITSKPERGPF